MDRSLYPEGVEVGQENLGRTEDTRSFHILERHTDNTYPGIVSGLEVTLNAGNNSLLDIASGYGYCSNGELVELITGITAIQLANYAIGTKNIICLIYTETNQDLKPHETDGDSYPTSANRSSRLRIYTETEFDLLPQTDDNLDNDALDRILIVAVVTAQGSGVSIPLLV